MQAYRYQTGPDDKSFCHRVTAALNKGWSLHGDPTLLPEALSLTHEIQKTGDIFFPKGWADATLGGYQSASAADIVRRFISALPSDYPPRLKWVIQASADPLFRAARITRTGQ